VLWPGRRDDIAAILAISDAFVLPSAYREGIPRVLLEAAAMGLPLVTTDSPGCNEVARPGENGFLVPVGDAAALTAAVEQLVADRELRGRLGAASRQRAMCLFDLRVIAGEVRGAYRRLLAAATARR
jgi:glycosyltransferase involved in cell wall biosynthesis